MSTIHIDTVFNIDLEFEIAPFHKRLFAYIIDFGLLVLYLFSMKYLLYAGLDLEMRGGMGLDILVISLPMLVYSLLAELWLNGQTVGKKLMSIRVISLDGGEPTPGQYLLRWITKFFEWPFLFGYIVFSGRNIIAYAFVTGFFGIAVVIIIAVTGKSQRLGDLAAGTVVVDAKSHMSVDDTVFMQVAETNYQVTFPQVMRLTDNDINTIKTVLTQSRKRKNGDMIYRVADKIQSVLQISTNEMPEDFLARLLADYNYLATQE